MSATLPPDAEKRLTACITLLRRTGAHSVQIRYSDDEEPTVWMAVGEWHYEEGRPVANGGETRWESAAAMEPVLAAFRLCESVLDGGLCVKCQRPAGVTFDNEPMPLAGQVCWWQYDSEAGEFKRGCDT